MKKLFISTLLLACVLPSMGQTVSEITRILNTTPQSVTTADADATDEDLIAALDLTTTGYRAVSIQIKGTWTGTVTFQGSNDNFTTVDNILAYSPTAGTWSATTTANGTFIIPSLYGKIRVRLTTAGTGTVSSVAYGFLNNVFFPQSNNSTSVSGTVAATQSGTWHIGNITGTVSLPTGAATAANQSTGNTSLATIAGAVAGTEMQVDVLTLPSVTVGTFPDNEPFNIAQINGVTPLMGAGNTGTGSLRVTVATDQAAIPVTGTFWQATQPVSGTVTINAIPTGTNNIGDVDVLSLPALPAGTNNIGDVDVLTLPSVTIGTFPDNEPFNVAQINGVTPLMGAGNTGTGSLRVTIATDQATVPVSLTSVPSHAVTNAGTFAVQVDGSALTALQLIDNIPNTLGSTTSGQSGVLALGAVTTAAPSYTNAQTNALSLTTGGALRVSNMDALPAGTNNIGDIDVLTFPDNEPFNVAQINGVAPLMGAGNTGTGSLRVTIATDQTQLTNALLMTNTPATTGGLTTYHLVSAASTNATNIKASAGQLYGYYIFNANASARKIAFHNTSGTPTAGASVFFSIVIPASSGANVEFTNGVAFSSGIGITTVTGTADSDATGVASGDLIINLFYK